jgi:hypothetical protein
VNHGGTEARLYCRAAMRVRVFLGGSFDRAKFAKTPRAPRKTDTEFSFSLRRTWRLGVLAAMLLTSRKESILPLLPAPLNQPTKNNSDCFG